MSEKIDTIIKTRALAAEICVKSLKEIDNISETDLREKLLNETSNYKELFRTGWYAPPTDGVSILFAENPFKRLQFKSLRNSESWPKEEIKFKKESVGIIYISPVNSKSKMLGDIGFTFYKGENQEIKKHIKKVYDLTLKMAEHAEVGMRFSELYSYTENLFQNELKIVGWMTTTSDPNKGINLGHTIPGSYDDVNLGNSFEEIKENITKKRVYINEVENFEIPVSCAFTVEARLADIKNPDLPNAFFHFIIVFNNGKKSILSNFDEIFDILGMDYMNK